MSKILFNLLGLFFKSQGYKNLDIGNLPDAELNFSRALELFDKSKNFASGFDCQIQLGNIYKISYLMDLAREMFNAALSLARQENNTDFETIAMTNLGMLFALDENYTDAKDIYEQAIKISSNNPELCAFVYQNYGVLEQQQQNYEKSAELFNLAIDEYDKIDLIPPQSLTYTDLGEVYVSLHDDEKAIKAWKNALLIYTKENDKPGIADIMLNLGQLQSDIGYLKKSQDINKSLGREVQFANASTSLALLLMEKGEYKQARNLLLEAVAIGIKLDLSSSLIRDYANLALLSKKTNDMIQYEKYLELAKSIAIENNDEDMLKELELSFSLNSHGE